MSLVSDILIANTLYKQVQSTYSSQSHIHNSAKTLDIEIELDKGRGLDVSKKQAQLQQMHQQGAKADEFLGKNLKDEQEVLNKVSKEKDTGTVSNENASGKDEEALKRLKQNLSSKIASLQMDDATENGKSIQKLEQQLQTVQSELQAIQTSSAVSELTAPGTPAATEQAANSNVSAGGNVDIQV